MRLGAGLLATALIVGGCVNPSGSRYGSPDVVGMAGPTEGTVVSGRVVEIEGKASGMGAMMGAGAGSAIGVHAIGAGTGAGVAGAVIGLVGMLLGHMAEEAVTSGEGIEYVVRAPDGQVVTVIQEREDGEEPLEPGTPVLVHWGEDSSRVIERPAGSGTRPLTDWKNPDAVPGATAGAAAGAEPPTARTAEGDWVNPDAVPEIGATPPTSAGGGWMDSEDLGEELPPPYGGGRGGGGAPRF